MSTVTDPDTMAELISACAELPDSVLHAAALPEVAEPTSWRRTDEADLPAGWCIDDECVARVAGIADYGS